jgi:hypothetical protein
MSFSGNFMPKRFGAGKPKHKLYPGNGVDYGKGAVRVLKDGKWQPKGKK